MENKYSMYEHAKSFVIMYLSLLEGQRMELAGKGKSKSKLKII